MTTPPRVPIRPAETSPDVRSTAPGKAGFARLRTLLIALASPTYQLVVMALCLAFAGTVSILIGRDTSWDLQNYHLYNAHAYVVDRISVDIAPAMRQSYHHPWLDIPFYYFVRVINDRPRMISFLMGLPYGLCIFLVVQLARETLFGRAGPADWPGLLFMGAAVTIGITGAATISVVGSTANELQVTALILFGLLVCVVRLNSAQPSHALLLLAGIAAGAGAALKLTHAPYALGLGAALVTCTLLASIRFSELISSGIGVVLGFFGVGGPWMYRLYTEFQNPLFPYFNTVFRSPFAEPVGYVDDRFGPSSFIGAVLYPFNWVIGNGTVALEVDFRDARFGAVLILAALALIAFAVRTLRGPRGPVDIGSVGWLLGVFVLVSYLAWMALFGIYRYTPPLEMVSGIVIVSLLAALLRQPFRLAAAAVALALVMVATTDPWFWGREDYEDRYLAVDAPEFSDRSIFVLLGNEPKAFIAPFLPQSSVLIGLDNNFLTADDDNALIQKTRALLSDDTRDRYVVTSGQEVQHSSLLASLRLYAGNECSTISSNIAPVLRACRLERREVRP